MRKKIIPFLIVISLIFCLCVIPVSADSADEDLPYIELTKFDDSMVMGVTPGTFYVMGDYGYVLDFSVTLGQISAYGYEITYSWTGNRPNVTGTSFGNTTDNSFRNYYVDGTNLGKIRGSFNGSVGSDVGISFNSSGCYVTVHSVRVFLVENFQVELSAYLYGNGTGVTWTPGSSASVSTTGYGSIEIDNWRNYDMINVSATLGGYGITSVSARLMDNTSELEIVIPFEMNYINLSDYNGEHENTLLTISCDMRGVDPATAPDSTLIISVSTSVPSGKYGYIQPTSIYGTVLVESPDEYLPWLKALIVVNGETSAFLYEFYSTFVQFSTDIQDLISSSFNDFKSFWDSSLDEKITSYKEWLYYIEESKNMFFDRKLSQIEDLLDNLINGNPVDTSVSQGMQDSAQSLGNLGSQMSADTPNISVDEVNVDVNSLVSSGGLSSASSLAVVVTSQPLIQKMLLIVISLALVGFVFFGKRG